jgi:type II secretory pathway pseudopilin PulG
MMTMTNNTSGWTLMETMIAVVMVGIVAAGAIPKFAPMLESMKLRTATIIVQRSLVAARTRAIVDPNVHCGVVFRDSLCMIFPDSLSAGTAYSADAQEIANKYLGSFKLPKNIFVYSLTTNPITNSCIVFRGDGSAKNGGSVYVVNRYNKKRTISVLATTGKIKVQ